MRQCRVPLQLGDAGADVDGPKPTLPGQRDAAVQLPHCCRSWTAQHPDRRDGGCADKAPINTISVSRKIPRTMVQEHQAVHGTLQLRQGTCCLGDFPTCDSLAHHNKSSIRRTAENEPFHGPEKAMISIWARHVPSRFTGAAS